MEKIAWRFRDMPATAFEPEQLILEQGARDGRLYFLVDGAVVILRDGVRVAIIDTPGAMFGEMSVLRGVPHSASVKAVADCSFYVVENARVWLNERPDVGLYIASILADRLAHTTAVLVEAEAAQRRQGAAQKGLVARVFGALAGHPPTPPAPPPADPS